MELQDGPLYIKKMYYFYFLQIDVGALHSYRTLYVLATK